MKTIKDILAKGNQLTPANRRAHRRALAKAYAQFNAELEGTSDADMNAKHLEEINASYTMREDIAASLYPDAGEDCWGRAIPTIGKKSTSYKVNVDRGDERLIAGASVSREGYSLGEKMEIAIGGDEGIAESIYRESTRGIQVGRANDVARSSHLEDGQMPGFVHFIDSVGLDHGMVKDGMEFSIEKAEKEHAIKDESKAFLPKEEWIRMKQMETTMKWDKNSKEILESIKTFLDKEKALISDMDQAESHAYIYNDSMRKLWDFLAETYGDSYVIPQENRGVIYKRYRDALWAHRKLLKLKVSFDKVNEIIEESKAKSGKCEESIAALAMGYEVEAKLDSVEIWCALKYARETEQQFNYSDYKVLREVALHNTTA